MPPLKKLARGAAAATKLLLEYRFECGKRARRTPLRVQGASRHKVARRLADADPGRGLTLNRREAKRRKIPLTV